MESKLNAAALQRLVGRHPSLIQDPAITILVSKGLNVTNEDIIDMCHKLLLKPELTIVIAGCFRHLLPQVVKSIVDILRESYSQRTVMEVSNKCGEECSKSIRSWSLCLHEYVAMAFSRLLELAPHLLSTIIQYFLFAPPPFERLLYTIGSAGQPMWQTTLLDVVRASYRFIQLEPASFENIWDWSPFVELLLYKDLEWSEQNVTDIRWCAVQILSLKFKLSDEATRAVSSRIACLSEEVAFSCLLRWEEFCQEIAVEKGGWFVEPPLFSGEVNTEAASATDTKQIIKWKHDMSSQITHVEICGIELPVRKNRIKAERWPPIFGQTLFPTSTLKSNLKALALALSQQEPVLLEGPPGCGKTAMIRELAEVTGNLDAVYVHLNEQADGKTLLGTYVCTEVPGDFRWQPGAVTQAVLKGLWLVFEDVNRAPAEVLSALVPLLESRKLYIPGRAETVQAAEGFQLFATVTRTDAVSTSFSPGRDILNTLWRRIVMVTPNNTELGFILELSFPLLRPVVPKLIGTWELINGFAIQGLSSIETTQRIMFGRQFSLRDLLKWCKRLKDIKELGPGLQTSAVCEMIYREAIDCFAAYICDKKTRHLVMCSVARLWGITEEQVTYFESLNKPPLQVLSSTLQVGRACLPVNHLKEKQVSNRPFAYTGHSMRNLERIAVCIQQQEPVLLVGETGTGKTTLVQHLAEQVSTPLIVMNLSQQSDSADFIGGFKPVEAHLICMKLMEKFKDLFCRTFPSQQNSEFLARMHYFMEKKKLKQLLKACGTAVAKVEGILKSANSSSAEVNVVKAVSNARLQPKTKRKRPLSSELMLEWEKFSLAFASCQRQVSAAESTFAFAFVEGAFVRALRNGHWILLDEVNLAPVETLDRLTGVLEGEDGSLNITERGDIQAIPRHPNFRVFACMNPATDVGKHDLPLSLKNRFTEIYVDELTVREDLETFVFQYLQGLMPSPPVGAIVEFYQQAQQEAEVRLFDSANQKPRYSLRSLARALEYTQAAMPYYGFARALYDGVCMTFLTLLDRSSAVAMETLIRTVLFKRLGLDLKSDSVLTKAPGRPSSNHIEFEHFWLERGGFKSPEFSLGSKQKYILTKTVREHLKNVAKAVFIKKYPVLLQGPTSSGKTSSIEYLATITGHRFVRINNHEHTDLQEYLGTYVTGPSGKLVFQEGILVEAVRNGYWIVLDELNLAPSEVLEALNRLLDDNRELFVPELQITIKPHPHFMLFATQNPPGLYGGRKALSRAFRNRFLELHVDDIPEDELCIILEERCEISRSYAVKMVAVMKDLQRQRQSSQVFAGKHGFITARDLFKWAERHRKSSISYEDLAKIGYVLLAERLRNASERLIVHDCLEKNLHCKIDIEKLYSELSLASHIQEAKEQLATYTGGTGFGNIVWTTSMMRLFSLVKHCYEHKEPMLLIGETGCGKTTVCQLLAMVHGQRLHILNCHQHTETADFLGGFRPVRERESIADQFGRTVRRINSSELFRACQPDQLPESLESAENTIKTLEKVIAFARAASQFKNDAEAQKEIISLELFQKELERQRMDWQALFIWQDGPLVQAMREGDLFLVDEISLADDSVLERLNSVLEPKRLLVLAEKGGSNVEELVAHPNFLLMATMNPGGDFGKKELSPALRNRFTEIWVPPIADETDLRSIIIARFSRTCLTLTEPLLNFWKWYQKQHSGRCLTVRDLLSWIHFINTVVDQIGLSSAFIHGAFLVLLDGIGLGMGFSVESARILRNKCLEFLLQQVPLDKQLNMGDFDESTMMTSKIFSSSATVVGINPFFIPKGSVTCNLLAYELMAPTTSINTFRILRAMQLSKPVLIEGSPGVGKTSLITALANISCHSLVRINLSEQTDMMDLLGSDLPVEGSEGAEFRWSDGVFLQALKSGKWVVLDELNLASQSVLEGLNACLDHRGEVFIPELGRAFKCHPDFRIFACQNPSLQGGGRKSLPRSFLNRFTKVYVDTLSEEDFIFISSSLHPSIPQAFLQKLVHFNAMIFKDTMVSHAYGHLGAPWEFNLRDVLRSCTLLEGGKVNSFTFLEAVYLQRMRTAKDRCKVLKLYEEVFGSAACLEANPSIVLDSKWLKIGNAMLQRFNGPQTWSSRDNLVFLPSQTKCLESLMLCVQHGWMSILIGPPACGKTSVVRLLAKMTGTPLQEFALSNGTDTTDLLGCFEQYDELRSWQKLVKKVHHLVQETCGCCLMASDDRPSADVLFVALKKLITGWSAFQMSSNFQHAGRNTQNLNQENFQSNRLNSLALLSNVLDHIRNVGSMLTESFSLGSQIVGIECEIAELNKKFSSKVKSNHFEWVDGGFLGAVERGDWVLLENANLCSPTVLDRLNPLLEPNGTILVNERGLVNGNAMVLRAHPNFRLFLTVDPNHGEVSRAMRNRGVEIFMMQPFTWIENVDVHRHDQEVRKEMEDCKHYLVHMGIPSCALVSSMSQAHMDFKLVVESSPMSYTASIRELGQWAGLFEQILRRGTGLSESLSCSWDQIYVQGCEDLKKRCAISNVFNAQLDQVNALMILQSTLQLPGGWPRPLKIEQFCRMSKEAMTLRDCMYLQVLLGKQVGHHIKSAWRRADSDEKRTLFEWLQSKKNLAVMLPAHLFQALMYPSVEFGFSEKNADLDMLDFDKMIIYASLWMMEQAGSRVANDMRLMWLNTQATKVGVYSNSLVLVCKMLKRKSEHPIFRQMLSALEEYGPPEDLQLRKLDAVRRTLMQWQIEDNMCEKYQDSTLNKRQSLLIQSFKFHTVMSRKKLTELKPNDLIEGLYPLFLAVRDLEQEIFCCTECVWNDKACKAYIRFLDSHKAFWKGACDVNSATKVDPQINRLFFAWKKLKKNAERLMSTLTNSGDNLQKVKDRLMHMFKGLERLLRHSRGEFKLLLLKHCGHPCIPSSKQAFHQLQAFLNFCNKLWPDNINGTRNSTSGSLSVVFRCLALEGIGMSMCLLQGSLKDGGGRLKMPKGGDTADPVAVASDILMNLNKRFEIEKLQREASSVRITGCCRCWPSHFDQNSEYLEVLLQDYTKDFKLLVFSWLDSLSLIKDSQIVASVAQIASGLDCKNVNDISFQEVQLKEELRAGIDFSLQLSSRSPIGFVPHQQILWLVNSSAGIEQQKCSFMKEFHNFAHQLRFNWHFSLWKNEPQCGKGLGIATTGADIIFNATNSARLSCLITQVVPIKQYERKILELRLAARVLWACRASGVQQWRNFDFLHASSVFCQTVLAFISSFKKDEAALLQAELRTLHISGGQGLIGDSNRDVKCLKVLLRKSTDHRFVALLDSHVDPCLDLLYAEWCKKSLFPDYLSVHGKIWLLLGATRLKLMLPRQAYDPAAKYAHEHAVLLEEISDAKLELQVRQESNSIVRGSSLSAQYWEFQCKIQDLEQEAMDRASKCAYREQPKHLDSLYREVGGFIESIKGDQDVHAWIAALEKKTEKAVVDHIKQEVYQWQDISMEFIQRLIVHYPDYQDLAQPVLLSVFEMKFGLSMLLSAFQQNQSLLQDGLNGHASSLYENLCHLMEYPSTINVFEEKADHSTITSAVPAFYFLDNSILESMSGLYGVEGHEKESFIINLKIKVFRCAIAHLKKAVLSAGFVHGTLLQTVLTLLESVSVFWNNVRDKLDARKEEEVSFIQFKHQSDSLGLEIDLDDQAFKAMFPQRFEFASENPNEVCTVEETGSKDATMSETFYKTWNIHASTLAKELFSLQSLFPGVPTAQDGERPCRELSDNKTLEAFTLSFDVGKTFLEGTCALLPASLNERLVLAKMLMLSIRHENLISPTEKIDDFNICQDASPSELAPLLKSLTSLQMRISELLVEWPDQPSLVQLMRGVESLLSMSIDVPLIKVLTGVEQLLSKAQLWEENAPKRLSLKDVLAGLHHLVSRWRKFELEHWEVLLREVEAQFEQDAEKLWFSLYAVLHPIAQSELESDFEPTIASLEEFMETATLGEFKKRFQMLMGFYGQFYAQQSFSNATTKILYNVLGYYSKFLPLIEDFTAAGKSEIEKELKNFLSLHKWDERNYYALLSSSGNTHRKLFKLISKYKVLLNKPALATVYEKKALNSSQQIADVEEKENGAKLADGSHGLDVKSDSLTSNENWQLYLQKKVQDLISFILNNRISEEVAGLFKELPSLLPQFWRLLNSSAFAKPVGQARQRGTVALEDLGTTVIIRSNELRESEKKRLPKKKALVDLLKELRNLGFSHHRSAIPREERMSKSWILQPACRVDEFLTTFQNVSTGCKLGTNTLGTEQVHNVSHLWSKACDYYFQNLALIQQLRQQSLSFHKDLMLQEVTAATAYVEHALYLQQRQRCFAQEYVVKLVTLQNIACQLGTFDNLDDGTILGCPELLRTWLWRQKDVLDSVYSICLETSLLYKKAEAVQMCPFDKSSSEFSAILTGLEKAAGTLSSCKRNLNKLLSPGVQIFPASDIALNWPVLITSSVWRMIVDNSFALQTVKGLIEKLPSHPGLSPLLELCGQASKMVDDFKEQSTRASSITKAELAASKEAYEKQRDQLVSEVLLAVQALNRITSRLKAETAADQQNCDYLDVNVTTAKSETIQSFASFIEEQMSGLRLEKIHQTIMATLNLGVKRFSSGDKTLHQELCKDFHALHEILELVIAAGLAVFSDYMSLHKSLTKLTYILSKLFGMLFQEGFCIKESEQEQMSQTEDGSGTGMGEGQGKTDVSHEIEDEDQLVGSTQKDSSAKADEEKGENRSKGVEMTEDFDGELSNISESDSNATEEDDNEGEELESKMGEGGENENIVDEKLWGKEDDEGAGHEEKEKYESGSSVQDSGTDLEFRAKEDGGDAANDEGSKEEGQLGSEQEHPKTTNDEQAEEDLGNMLDKCDAYEPSSGIDPSAETSDLEKDTDLIDEDNIHEDFDEINESIKGMDFDNDASGTPEGNELEQELSDKAADDMDYTESSKDTSQEETKNQLNADLTVEQQSKEALENGVPQGVNGTELADPTHGHDLSMDLSTELTQTLMDLSTPKEPPGKQSGGLDLMARDPSAIGQQKQTSGSDLSGNNDAQTLDRLDADPYRCLGDYLKAWKERVVVTDESIPETNNVEATNEDSGHEGMEYQYVREDESTGAQALGSATADQINQSRVDESDLDRNMSRDVTINTAETKIKGDSKMVDQDTSQIVTKRKVSEKVEGESMEDKPPSGEGFDTDVEMGEVPFESEGTSDDPKSYVSTSLDLMHGESLGTNLTLNATPYRAEDVQQIRRELEMVLSKDDQSIHKARALWSKYEQLTTRLSQELTEQLRLIMEPTLAARLEGDYRTGKRINLKKVIPYIASQFRRDKIWLRRTKPSKRQYQVVLAIDDSRSMSESHCGHTALEALITICRSMSTLEVGQMAVASFGQKGNVKLLHDFDTPFSTEAGIQIISQFSFKQENTIKDEPMVDLLHYLTWMLDAFAMSPVNSSRRQELRQLILIIADGRFHEKETLRRCIREAVSRGQMLAFIVLDNARESIMDVQSVSFSGGAPTFSKYIDTFPFPYYILLKNIEELPRTLADLLRQWFELNQRAKLQ